MNLAEYSTYDGVGLAALVAAKQVTALELTELALAAADATTSLNAFVEVYADARERAQALDLQPLGPLSGVPMVRKDIGASEAGKGTELGSRLAAGLVTHRDGHLTAAFKAAGLAIVGRSTTSEMGCYGTVESAATGITANPWAAGVTSGGSSGGSAALVAAGVVPIGHANDGAGSIRIPASCCGLVGLKPSRGRVSAGPGAGEPNFGGSVQLVVTRSLADTAAVLDAVSGPRPGDPFVIPAPSVPFAELAAAQAVRPLRIGWTNAPWGPSPVDSEVAAAVLQAARLLEELGHQVEQADFPFDYDQFEQPFADLWAVGVAGPIPAIGERMHRPLTEEFLEPVTLAWIEHAKTLSALDVAHALYVVNRMARRSGEYFSRFDLLLVPTLAQLPAPHGVLDGNHPDMDSYGNARAMLAFNPYCPLFNLTGQPAITLPLAESTGGLPIGVQLVARHAEEALLVAVGAQLERAQPWSGRRPPVHVASASGPGRRG